MSFERYSGQVTFMYAYDVAYDTRRTSIPTLLGQPVRQFRTASSRRGPRQLRFYLPQMVTLEPQAGLGPGGRIVTVRRTIKIFPVGAISISLSVPFEDTTLEEMTAYHDLPLGEGTVDDEARKLAQQALAELQPCLVRPVAELADEEAYTVFCLRTPKDAGRGLEDWLVDHRRSVAALLTQEPQPQALSDQEAFESTQVALSYYEQDLAVIDWDAALLVDDQANFDETLHIMELANVQLSELETYDKILDDALERSYRDMGKRRSAGHAGVLRELREIRVDLARVSDELSNTTKFFGDWHLARLYQSLSARFHLAEWHREIDEKLRTLDSLYSIMKQDQLNWFMLVLEITIVLLFIIDLVVLVMLPTIGK